MEYRVNNVMLSYEAIGARCWGPQTTLLATASDLTRGTTWHDQGFTIEKLLDDTVNHKFEENATMLLRNLWRQAGLNVPEDLNPAQYHTIAGDWETHLQAVDKTKLLPVSQFPLPIELIESQVSDICKATLVARNPYDGEAVYHFRVIRPGKFDNNPLHRDVWLEDYEACINLYIPVAGSDERSSLIIVPGSHLWPESRVERTEQGALVNNVRFNVPAVTDIAGPFEAIRANPGSRQMLVFSPYLIHGGAVNLNTDTTRISVELRLWKK